MDSNRQETLLLIDRISPWSFLVILLAKAINKEIIVFCGQKPSPDARPYSLEWVSKKFFNTIFVWYEHLDLFGDNLPEALVSGFGELKDNVNERSFVCCEKLFTTTIAGLRGYKQAKRFLYDEARVENIYKRELLSSYCKRYVNLFECARMFTARLQETNLSVYLLLTGDSFGLWNIYNQEFKPFSCRARRLFTGLHSTAASFLAVLGNLAVCAIMLYSALRRAGFKKCSANNGQITGKKIILSTGCDYKFLVNFFSETSSFESRFTAKESAFIVEGPDTGGMDKYALAHGIGFIDPEAIPISCGYFFEVVLRRVCFSFLLKQALISFFEKSCLTFSRINYHISKDLINFEIICRMNPVKIFFISRYFDENTVKTIVINRHGGSTASMQDGDFSHPFVNVFRNAYCTLNHLFVYGQGALELKAAGQHIDEYHPIGSDRLDFISQNRENISLLKSKYAVNGSFVLTVFGPAYNDTLPRKRHVLKFYTGIIAAFNEVKNCRVKMIIKAHKKKNMADGESDFQELAGLLSSLRGDTNVLYCYHENPYELMLISDLVITWSTSTTGLEAIAAGKKTVFCDPMNSRFHPYRKYHESLVVSTCEKLKELVASSVRGRLPITDDVYEFIKNKYCFPNDGQSFQRLLNRLSDICAKQKIIRRR